ncbi:hypothetical protein FSARC_5892 [Fusarium sarcochroum]|uniref:Uncharacterized protein n=1 Tax=Fusarium sarcochroum TaxID=1208366 RepID=A0A8H4TYI4_9HYPO|nr:hypothetical protein FSARC_5892 [Fusarium sarcochroum]
MKLLITPEYRLAMWVYIELAKGMWVVDRVGRGDSCLMESARHDEIGSIGLAELVSLMLLGDSLKADETRGLGLP